MISSKKLKVLHVIEALGGGVYSYFCDLTNMLCEDGRVDLYIAYSNKRNEIDPDKVSQELHQDAKLILLDLTKEISPVQDFNGVKQIKKVITQIDPDIIHLHSSKAGILGKIAISQLQFNKPSYYTPHGYSFLRQDVRWTKRKLYNAIEYLFTRYSRTVTIACGDTELEYAKKMKSNALLIRNGVNIKDIDPLELSQNQSFLTFGTLGRISFQKNPKLFNDFASCTKHHQFLWIGDGDLRKLITAKNIKVTGWFKKRAAAFPHLKQINVYLQTSLWEGLPIAMIEAMAMGIPVIATNVIGNKDLVKDGETGFLIQTTDQFITCVKKLEDQHLRHSMGMAGRARAEKLFDCHKNFKSLVDLYLKDYSSNSWQKY